MKEIKLMLWGIMLVLLGIFSLLCSMPVPAVVLALVGVALFLWEALTKTRN